MSIKKTPICPFCEDEMKELSIDIASEGAIIITERRYNEEREFDEIKGTLGLRIYHCESCNYIAFWYGEPK